MRFENSVPAGYAPWVPRPDEVNEEGFGFFIGTWALGRVPLREAREVVDAESAIASLVDALAGDDYTYEEIAGAVESSNAADVPDDVTARTRVGAARDVLRRLVAVRP